VGIACLCAAFVFGFIIYPIISGAASSNISIVRAKTDISQGTRITADMLETVKMGKQNLPDGIQKETAAVAGKYAAVDVTAQDIITSAKLSGSGGIFNLSDGQLLISVAVKNFADSLSGKLQSGDVVSVFFPPESGNSVTGSGTQSAAKCPPELQYVKVAAVTASDGQDTNEETVKKQADSGSDKNLPATVTLLVNARQAQILAGQESNTVHLALAARESKKAENLLKLQTEYFKQNAASSATSSSSKASSSSPSDDGLPSVSSSPSLDTSASLGVAQ